MLCWYRKGIITDAVDRPHVSKGTHMLHLAISFDFAAMLNAIGHFLHAMGSGAASSG